MDYFTWNIDRDIFSIGPIVLRWYSLMFAAGFAVGYMILRRIFIAENKTVSTLDSLLVYLVVGTIVGARLGHCLFYDPYTYLHEPLRILKVWEGGLASHGGYTGLIIALALFVRRFPEFTFFWLVDRVAIVGMLAGGFIRLGNFFNSEILGKETDVPWAIIFSSVDQVPRHPAQLYESVCYFFTAGVLYTIYRARNRKIPEGFLIGTVFVLGFSLRFLIEFFKESQASYEQGLGLTMGQTLSIPFILVGIALMMGLHRKWLLKKNSQLDVGNTVNRRPRKN